MDATLKKRQWRRTHASVEPLVVPPPVARQLLGGISETKYRGLVKAGVIEETELDGMRMATMASIKRAAARAA